MYKIILNFISGKFYAKIGHNTKQMSVWKVQTGSELQILYQVVGTQQSQDTSWRLHNLSRLETTVVIGRVRLWHFNTTTKGALSTVFKCEGRIRY